MTTADYLESLQNDLNAITSDLGLEDGTNFSDIAVMTGNGDITRGGSGGLDWSALGYDEAPQTITEDYNYALEIKNNWNPTITSLQGKYQDNLNIVYMPRVDISNATTMQAMFWGCNNLAEIEFSHDNPINLTSFRSTFGYCKRLLEANLSNFEATNVTTFAQMFRECSNIKRIDLSKMNPTTISDTSNMFNGCVSLEFLDIRSFEFSRSSNVISMFGENSSKYIPLNCLIIVKDQTQKTWFSNTFPSLTNVRTIDEYNAM